MIGHHQSLERAKILQDSYSKFLPDPVQIFYAWACIYNKIILKLFSIGIYILYTFLYIFFIDIDYVQGRYLTRYLSQKEKLAAPE